LTRAGRLEDGRAARPSRPKGWDAGRRSAGAERKFRIVQAGRNAAEAPELAFFLPTLAGGGAEKTVLALAAELVARGRRVDLVVGKYIGALTGTEPNGLGVVSLDARRVLTSGRAYADYLRWARPAVVVSAVENANIVSCLARLSGAPRHRIVVHVDSALWPTGGAFNPVRRLPWLALSASAFQLADLFVPVSGGIEAQLRGFAGLGRKPIRRVYNPVIDPGFFERAAAPLPIPRPGSGPLIVAVGRLVKDKDYPNLLAAFALLPRELDSQLLIVGEGPDLVSLVELGRRLGVAERVHFCGFHANPLPFMRAADVFVLSSKREGLPTVLIEALACGARVVSTDCRFGPREILKHGALGRLVPIADPAALQAAIFDALEGSPPDPSAVSDHLTPFAVDHATSRFLEVIGAPV
jgi:glycosyltransferase involved in cell wall biosynthesis